MNLLNRTVHQTVLVAKDPEPNDLATEPLDILAGVRLLNPHEHHEPHADPGLDTAVNADSSLRYPLNHCAHGNWLAAPDEIGGKEESEPVKPRRDLPSTSAHQFQRHEADEPHANPAGNALGKRHQ